MPMPVELQTLQVRTFRHGDEVALNELWNMANEGHAGWVHRSPDYWYWLLVQRPDIGPDSLMVCEADLGEAVGYAALAASGAVVELVVTPTVPESARYRVATELLDALELRAHNASIEELDILVPRTDTAVCRAATSRGYRDRPMGNLQLSVVDAAALLRLVLATREPRDAGTATRLRLDLDAGQSRTAPVRQLWIDLGTEWTVMTVPCSWEPDAIVATDMTTLSRLALGDVSVESALSEGLVDVSPHTARQTAAHFLALVAPRQPWFIPRSDVR